MSLNATLDDLLQGAVARGDVPGVTAAVTHRDETIYEGAFGERELGSGLAMSPDTVVWIASMTKAITGTAAMQLVEQGKLALDDPARDVVPHLGEVQVLDGFDDAGQPITRAPKQPVTLRYLLTHTADLESADYPLSGSEGDSWDNDLRKCRLDHALVVRSG